MFDADGGGSITHDEFRTKMLNSGLEINVHEIDEIINEVDSNHDGVINLRGMLFSWTPIYTRIYRSPCFIDRNFRW